MSTKNSLCYIFAHNNSVHIHIYKELADGSFYIELRDGYNTHVLKIDKSLAVFLSEIINAKKYDNTDFVKLRVSENLSAIEDAVNKIKKVIK